MKYIPPRLHVVFASKANYAVIVRRGPSQFASTFGWDMDSNEIMVGQWLKGRIHGRKSSLSPNGQFFLYSAMNGKWQSETKGRWAAISRSPFLKAIELYSDIESRGGGGGLFVSNQKYYLNDVFYNEAKFLKRSNVFRCLNKSGDHCMYGANGVYLSRLKMLGWKFEESKQFEQFHNLIRYSKKINRNVMIHKYLLSKYPAEITEWEEHEIYVQGKLKFSTKSWECAEVKNNRIYFTENGFLKFIEISPSLEILPENVVHDFNDYRFVPIGAPYDDFGELSSNFNNSGTIKEWFSNAWNLCFGKFLNK